MCIIHKWGPYREKFYNSYPYVIPKKEFRECEKCHKEEVRDLPSLEKRIFMLEHEGLTEKEIQDTLEKLMKDYGPMRFHYCIKKLLEEVREGRKVK